MNTATQTLEILRALLRGERLTQLGAIRLFGCTRLGARIYDLKHDHGVNIESAMVRTAEGKHVKEYWLSKDELKRLRGLGAVKYAASHHTLPRGLNPGIFAA